MEKLSRYFIFIVSLAFLPSCGITKKVPKVDSQSLPSAPKPAPTPTPGVSELPFIYGVFKNTGNFKTGGTNWQEVVHWTLKISETEAEFRTLCEFSGAYTAQLTAAINSRVEVDLKKNRLIVFEDKFTQTAEGELTCPVRTLPGDYQFEVRDSLLRLFIPGTSTEYLYIKQ